MTVHIISSLKEQKLPVLSMDLLITKIDVILFVTGELLMWQRRKCLRRLHKHHLRPIFKIFNVNFSREFFFTDMKKTEAIVSDAVPENSTQLQTLCSKFTFMKRFIRS